VETVVQWDVTGLVKDWLKGAPNYGLVLKDDTSDGTFRGVRFDSRSELNLTIPLPTLGVTKGPRLVLTQLRPGIDFHPDGIIDSTDLTILLNAVKAFEKPTGPDDPRDIDKDSRLTVLDVRQLSFCCTWPGCKLGPLQ
jgi:hypothetical protein